jgi:hypothetical protein
MCACRPGPCPGCVVPMLLRSRLEVLFVGIVSRAYNCFSLHVRSPFHKTFTVSLQLTPLHARRCAVRRENPSVLAPCLYESAPASSPFLRPLQPLLRCASNLAATRIARSSVNNLPFAVLQVAAEGISGESQFAITNVSSDREDGGNHNLVGTLKQKGQAFS